MNRRRLLRLTIGMGMTARTFPLWAQSPATGMRRVGVLAPSTRAKEEAMLKPFFDEMRLLGWIEGQNIAYDHAYAGDWTRDLPRLAAELVARKPELIYAPPSVAAVAARQATRTIPIVFGTGTDPVGVGLVASLAAPGGNVTGVVNAIDSLAPKRIELLRQILPGVKRLGLVGDPNDPRLALDRDAITSMPAALGLTLIVGEASNPVELDAAMARLIGQGVHAILPVTSITANLRGRIVELANRRRVPVVGGHILFAEAGGLFSYGASLQDQIRRSAHLVDKLLKGADPARVPVEQPTRYELVINLKAAKGLGLTIPQVVLLRADEVIWRLSAGFLSPASPRRPRSLQVWRRAAYPRGPVRSWLQSAAC